MARPRKQVHEGEEDDQPTYVVDDSQDILSKAEYEALVAADKEDNNSLPSSAKASPRTQDATVPEQDEAPGEAAVGRQQVAVIGGSTKRRLAKVIGDEGEEDEASPGKSDSGKKGKKPKIVKGKKVKLSFDEDCTEP